MFFTAGIATAVLDFTVNSFDERVAFVVPFAVTDTDTRHFPTLLNDNTPLRNEHTPVARYVRVPLIFNDTSFDAFNVAPTVSVR
jgi:hypothetical protein